MNIIPAKRQTPLFSILWSILVMALSLVTGCKGLEPFEPRDDREQGPEQGLFSGEQGEFVIHRKDQESKTDNKTSQ